MLPVKDFKQEEVFLIHWTIWAKGGEQDLGDPQSAWDFGLQSSTKGELR